MVLWPKLERKKISEVPACALVYLTHQGAVTKALTGRATVSGFTEPAALALEPFGDRDAPSLIAPVDTDLNVLVVKDEWALELRTDAAAASEERAGLSFISDRTFIRVPQRDSDASDYFEIPAGVVRGPGSGAEIFIPGWTVRIARSSGGSEIFAQWPRP